MTKYKIELFVGFFIIFSVVCFFVIMLNFSEVNNITGVNKKYKLKAIFRNVGHLKVKAKVTICGVKVGYIDSIKLVKDSSNAYYVEVGILIDLNVNCIPKDSTASIFMTNLLGENYLQIDLGNDDSFLRDGDIIFLTNQALIIEDLISKFAFNK